MSDPVSSFAEHLPSPAVREAAAGVGPAEAVESDVDELAAVQVGVRGGTTPEWVGHNRRTMRSALNVVVVGRVWTGIGGTEM